MRYFGICFLITMAQDNNLTIITKNSKIPLYDVKTIW